MLDLLRAASGIEPWAPTGEVVDLRLGSHEVLATVKWDHDELRRRRQHQLRALPNRRALQLLLSMPRGVAVPQNLLRTEDQQLLRGLPAGVVATENPNISVSLRPALALLSVGVVASTWKRGLRQSGSFASYCTRYVVLDGFNRGFGTSLAVMEARYYGVGLAVHHEGSVEWLVSPAPFRADRFTAASWLMAERVTEALAPHAGAVLPLDVAG